MNSAEVLDMRLANARAALVVAVRLHNRTVVQVLGAPRLKRASTAFDDHDAGIDYGRRLAQMHGLLLVTRPSDVDDDGNEP